MPVNIIAHLQTIFLIIKFSPLKWFWMITQLTATKKQRVKMGKSSTHKLL